MTANSGRRAALTTIAAGLAVPGMLTRSAYAQSGWPNRPVKIVVPFPAGTSPDAITRMWSERMSKLLGQALVVDNRPGAATIIGTQLAAQAAGDGYTLLTTAQNTFAINPHVYKSLPYKLEDFVPVSLIAAVPLVAIVGANSPLKSLQDLFQAAKAKPGQMSFASYGIGQGTHVAMVRMLNAAGVSMTHVPYRDGGITDVMAGVVDLSFEAATTAIPQARGGKVRALAVSSERRNELLPDVPTVAETLPGFTGDSWIGLLVPKGTPPEIVARLAAESQKVIDSEDFRKRLREFGLTPLGGSPVEFARHIAEDSRAWAKVVRDNGIRVE